MLSTYSQDKAPAPAASPAAEVQYKPLTKAEAETWLKSITMDQLLDFVIKYDEVEHSKLVFTNFDYVCVVSGQSVSIIPVTPQIEVKLASLGYKVQLPTMTFKDVVPKPESHFWRDFGIGAGVGVVALAVIEIAVASLVK